MGYIKDVYQSCIYLKQLFVFENGIVKFKLIEVAIALLESELPRSVVIKDNNVNIPDRLREVWNRTGPMRIMNLV